MLRARFLALTFAAGTLAVVACGNSGDDEAAAGGAGQATGGAAHPGGVSGNGGTPGAKAGQTGAGAAAAGTSTSGGAGVTGTAGSTGAAAGGTAGGTSRGGATSTGGATSGGGTSGAGRPGSGAAGGASGGKSGRGNNASGAGDRSDAGASGSEGGPSGSDYDTVVLADAPVLYFAMTGTTREADLTGNGHDGSYQSGAPARATLPNGDAAAAFDGVEQYLTVPSAADLSIPTTHELTWEAWIRPDTLQFSNDTSDGYVDWMGKCADYSPTCEWEARMYSQTNAEDRCNRLSAYAFNPGAGEGSGAFWQQTDCGTSIRAGAWYHIVGEYTTLTQPAACDDTYPGSIDIWVNGVRWNQASHGDTGCMSQYQVVPVANDSPLNIGTMAKDSWFQGAIGKVAIYDKLLGNSVIARHYTVMTGSAPSGSCADTCSF